jgi:hypothetical protein
LNIFISIQVIKSSPKVYKLEGLRVLSLKVTSRILFSR